MRRRAFLIGAALLLWLGLVATAGAQLDPRTQLLTSINGARAENGLPPLALNQSLSAAAQRHSEDMAANDFVDHTGSDGSRLADRLAADEFPRYPSGLIATQAVYRSSTGPQEAFDWWMSSPSHEDILLSTYYREIGLGMAVGENGRTYWTVTLGARPNVLPVFINGGAVQTDDRQVLLTLSNEGGLVNGDGPDVMGLATEMRVSNQADLADAAWQPWAAELAWELSAGDGEMRVAVEFRDSSGRTATSQASIVLGSLAATAEPTAEATVEPTAAIPTLWPTLPALEATSLPELPAGEATGEPTRGAPVAAAPAARPVPIWRGLELTPEKLWPLACGLQALAILLGFLVAVQRPRRSK